MDDKGIELAVWEALRAIRFPGMSRDIVSFGFVDRVTVDDGKVGVSLKIVTANEEAARSVRDEVERVAAGVDSARSVEVQLELSAPPSRGQQVQQSVARDRALLPDVTSIVAVASGKGGVGKSTVASNLAVRLAQQGRKVGLLDADIYGPSMPLMFGIHRRPIVREGKLVPFERYGVQLMSLGFVVDPERPVIWRGPMVMKALEQLLGDVHWGELDVMIVDLPPGTGDAQLTLSQRVPLSGAVIVTTPQDVALADARKGLAMFQSVNVPVIGIVENMSGFVCPHCGEETEVFKRGGGERTARELGTRFLGAIPLDPAFVVGGDRGEPVVAGDPEGRHAKAFDRVAAAVWEEIAAEAGRPTLSIS